MTTEQAEELLRKYVQGTCTEEEKALVEQWYASLAEKGQWEWGASEREAFQEKLHTRVQSLLQQDPFPAGVRSKRLFYFAAAAAVLLSVSAVGYRLMFGNAHRHAIVAAHTAPKPVKDIQPGMQGAILTLANGQQIALDSTGNGILSTQSNMQIINRNGQLIYDGPATRAGADEVVYNTIATPRARQFRLQLSDGTKVWLNAASSIRYPARFSGSSRMVEVSGEAYFEVASIALGKGAGKMPFLVKIVSANGGDGGRVEVTGTHFDINAYEDEALIKTTLLEGGIRFKKGEAEQLLIPGQQAQLNKNGTIRLLKNANTGTEIAWKNGYFTYDKTDIQVVMKQIARWYDIEVDYEDGKIPNEKYWGDIERDASLSSVLKVLEMSGVQFKVEGRKVTVMKDMRG